MKHKRILFVEPNINPPGGAQCVAAWALQALLQDYKVKVLTWQPTNFEAVNRAYGTQLDVSRFRAHCAPAWLRHLIALDPDPESFQQLAILMRWANLYRKNYDLIVSFVDEVCFGIKAIQYIHYPYLAQQYHKQQRLENIGGASGWWQSEMFKRRPWRMISGFSFEKMKQNITLVNSGWTGALIRQTYNIPTTTLYPPVPGDFPQVPWAERENGFVCIGRIESGKRYHEIVSILSQVHALGQDIHLHIVGAAPSVRYELPYYRRMMDLFRANADWISVEENLSRVELTRLITQHRYGIHAKSDEHFGIAVAELVRGGCVTFVPNGGGQVEIVGEEMRLRYASNGDAVEKIARVLNDVDAQPRLHQTMLERGAQFTPEIFMERLCAIVAARLKDA